jgi:hypothetical protein
MNEVVNVFGRHFHECLELVNRLEKGMVEKDLKRKEWPKSPAALSKKLIRLASFLRRVGIDVQRHEPRGRSRSITLERIIEENSVHAVHGVQKTDFDELDSDDVDDMDDRNHEKSIPPLKPTPEGCGECEHYLVEHGRISCNIMDEKLKNMDSCPFKSG